MAWYDIFGGGNKSTGNNSGTSYDDTESELSGPEVDDAAFAPRSPAKLQKAGDVVYNEVLIISETAGVIDIKEYVVEINIYEDIFSPCLHGNIIIRDTQNLIEKVPIIGDEILTLDISTPQISNIPNDPTNYIQKSFAIYAIKNRILSNEDKEQLYSLHFISMEGIMDNVSYICQKFEGTTDEIVQKVFDDNFKDLPRYLNASNTKETAPKTGIYISDQPHSSKVSFLPTMWTPFQIMNYLAKRSLGNTLTEAPTYLFYETTKSFYFCSLSGLIKDQLDAGYVANKFKYRKKTHDEQLGEEAIKAGYTHIENLEFLTNMDVLQGQDLGHFASSLCTLDMVNKEYVGTVYDHGFDFQKYPHLGNYESTTTNSVAPTKKEKKYNSIFPANVIRSADSKVFVETIHRGVLDNQDDTIMNLHPEKYVQQRNSLFSDITTMKMKITVPGRTNMEVGTIVDLDYPSVASNREQGTNEDIRDKWVSGYYMITAIHHQITKLRHNAICEISKDSYLNELVTFEEAEPATTDSAPAPANPPTTNTTPSPTS